jgi:hypothetical protein
MEEDIEVTTQLEASFDGDYDYKPLDKSFLQRMEEKVFRVMSGQFLKRKKVEKKETVAEAPIDDLFEPAVTKVSRPQILEANPIDGHPLVTKEQKPIKKAFVQRIKDSIKFPSISKVNAVINGIALAVFAAGLYVLYTALPTRPELVLGIIMVSVAGNVIVSSR